MILIRLLLIFGVGCATWWLALARTYALLEQRRLLVCSLIFIEETIMLGIGIWLARAGSVPDIISCALGGTFAAYLVMRNKHGGGSKSNSSG